jgi:enoyl-CoA hydratase
MDEVLYRKEGRTGLITINRPEARNPLNMAVFKGLNDILDQAADPEIRTIIITGAGSAFVAGADIKELLGYDISQGFKASRFQQSVFNKLERLGKPSIAAINGFAMGGGLELALSCTFRIAAPTAKLGFPELGLGIIPAFGGTERLIRTIGYAKASELILFRTILNAEQALAMGLVNKITDDALAGAKEWAENLSALSPTAVRLELELLLHQGNMEETLALEASLAALAVSSLEAKELLGRFVNKGK